MKHTEPLSFAALNSATADARPTAMGGRMTLEDVPLDPKVEARNARREAEADRLEAAMRSEVAPRKTDAADRLQRIRDLCHLRDTNYHVYMATGPDGISPSDRHLALEIEQADAEMVIKPAEGPRKLGRIRRVSLEPRPTTLAGALASASFADAANAILETPEIDWWSVPFGDEEPGPMTGTDVLVQHAERQRAQEVMRWSIENIKRLVDERCGIAFEQLNPGMHKRINEATREFEKKLG